MMIFCTLFDSNYLDKGLALWQSLQKVSSEYRLYIFCFDDKSFEVLNDMKLQNIVAIHHSQIETEELLKLKKERSKAEYCWTCTPVIVEYVLDKYNESNCTYIDADMFFFSNPQILYDEIADAKANVVITEHRFKNDVSGRRWLRKSGKYCVEFNYFDKSENATEALRWWKEKCFEWCFALYEPDRMGDQKYLEKFPVLFNGVHELQHLGGGVAPWNLKQYSLVKADGTDIVLKKKNESKLEFPLVFYHFQNVKYLSHTKVNINSGTKDKKVKMAIYKPYLRAIEENRELLKQKYGIEFAVNKSYSSNKLKAFIQKYVMKFKVKSLSDIVSLDRGL